MDDTDEIRRTLFPLPSSGSGTSSDHAIASPPTDFVHPVIPGQHHPGAKGSLDRSNFRFRPPLAKKARNDANAAAGDAAQPELPVPDQEGEVQEVSGDSPDPAGSDGDGFIGFVDPAAKRELNFGPGPPPSDPAYHGHSLGQDEEDEASLTQYIERQVDKELENSIAPDDNIEEYQEDSHSDYACFTTPPARPAPSRLHPPLTIPKLTPGGSSDGTVHLRPTSDVPARFRPVFSEFTHFNIMQTTVFDDIVSGDAAAVVVSSPTGSGKTVVFELAMTRAASGRESPPKMVYLSPMKSLCSERHRDWSAKFGPLGLRCLELTGDSTAEDVAAINGFDIVLTTPEKWDVVTRRWKDHVEVARAVGLVMIDEVNKKKMQLRYNPKLIEMFFASP